MPLTNTNLGGAGSDVNSNAYKAMDDAVSNTSRYEAVVTGEMEKMYDIKGVRDIQPIWQTDKYRDPQLNAYAPGAAFDDTDVNTTARNNLDTATQIYRRHAWTVDTTRATTYPGTNDIHDYEVDKFGVEIMRDHDLQWLRSDDNGLKRLSAGAGTSGTAGLAGSVHAFAGIVSQNTTGTTASIIKRTRGANGMVTAASAVLASAYVNDAEGNSIATGGVNQGFSRNILNEAIENGRIVGGRYNRAYIPTTLKSHVTDVLQGTDGNAMYRRIVEDGEITFALDVYHGEFSTDIELWETDVATYAGADANTVILAHTRSLKCYVHRPLTDKDDLSQDPDSTRDVIRMEKAHIFMNPADFCLIRNIDKTATTGSFRGTGVKTASYL